MQVRWGSSALAETPGVYLVASTDDADDPCGIFECPLDLNAVRRLLHVRPEVCVDGVPGTLDSVAERLRAMWVTGEPVVYIGLAGTSIAKRVGQFYSTLVGARGPHAGGWPVKMLQLDRLRVHYAECGDPNAAEREMVSAFASGLSEAARSTTIDADAVAPFANLMIPGGRRKRHGLTGAKESRISNVADSLVQSGPEAQPPTASSVMSRPFGRSADLRTQNITASDIGRGIIRVPSATKRILPAGRSRINVVVSGENFPDCRWDPKLGPDKERSGTLSIPKAALQRLVQPGGPLTVTCVDGVVRLC